jgi:GNAT superfamily N-acetyltransferase
METLELEKYKFENVEGQIISAIKTKSDIGRIHYSNCFIRYLYVNESHRNQGLATRLMNCAIQDMENVEKCSSIRLFVSPQEDGVSKVRLFQFYGKFGFIRDNESESGMIRSS